MCGICGYAGLEGGEGQLRRMMDAMTHRGPDEAGHYGRRDIGLGFRRLSIIDVESGQQPIWNEDKTVALIFNGEIYNYRDLTRTLIARGHKFATRSDSETIVHLYEEYGIDALNHLRGMFAIAIWDSRSEELYLARDRVGIKPLYYWNLDGRLVFGSEVKSILACKDVPREPNAAAIDAFLTYRFSPGPETLFKDIVKLPAGHWLRWCGGALTTKRYWSLPQKIDERKPDSFYQEKFEAILTESVKMRLMSEVPLGAYLSGGLDSSAIVALMAQESTAPVKTFSVGFGWKGDELDDAAATAKMLGCDHEEVVCRPEDMALLPEIVGYSDEPPGDAIALPTFLLSRQASKKVRVVMTGEGADETLAGYMFHKVLMMGTRYKMLMPRLLHFLVVTPLVGVTPTALLNLFFDYPSYLGDKGRDKIVQYLGTSFHGQIEESYRSLISLFDPKDKRALYSDSFASSLRAASVKTRDELCDFDRMIATQFDDWLPDNVLFRQDKLSMANSLEARVPFLDHELIEFLWQVPPHLKLRGGRNKVLLRNYMGKQLSQAVARRRKKPFFIPMEEFFGHRAFRDLVDQTLNTHQIKNRGYFNTDYVANLCERLDRREFLAIKQAFALITLELWHQIFIDKSYGV